MRSPGVYFERSVDKATDKDVYVSKIIPSRGAWLEFEIDKPWFRDSEVIYGAAKQLRGKIADMLRAHESGEDTTTAGIGHLNP